MSNKKISIVTVNYNDRAGLEKTINSVITQTYSQIEFIVIDGNSTDGSKDVINKFSNFFTYSISEPDNGIYNAMNKGIKVATGDYLLFLNSGDSLHSDTAIESVVKEMIDTLDIYYGDIIYDEIHQQNRRNFPDRLTFGFFLAQNLSHQASFIKRELFDTVFLYNEDFKIVSDWEFFTYAICKKEVSYQHLNLVVTNYDATGISSDMANHPLMYIERAQSLDKYFHEFIADYNYLKLVKIKKVDQLIYIKQFPIAYKILKTFMNLILLFLPKFNKTN